LLLLRLLVKGLKPMLDLQRSQAAENRCCVSLIDVMSTCVDLVSYVKSVFPLPVLHPARERVPDHCGSIPTSYQTKSMSTSSEVR